MDSARHAAFETAHAREGEDPAAPGNTAVDLAVDLADERPSQGAHGLRPDRTSRWLVGAMVGTALAVIAIVTAVRSASDDRGGDEVAREVPLLEAQLAAPLSFAVISLERVRVEWITTEILRTMDHPIAKASKRAPKTPVHATSPGSSGAKRHNVASGGPKLSELPPPQVDAPADAPAEPEPEKPEAPPAALPGVDAPEPDVVDDEV